MMNEGSSQEKRPQNILLEFLPNPADEGEGMGHAGIWTYRNDPFAAAAREPGQNSRDVAVSYPVRMRYDVLHIPRRDIPGIGTLEEVIEICLEQSAGQEKEKAFFQQALKVVRQEVLPILRISDFNTTGAKGPPVSGTAFHSLIKGSGVSVKTSADSGGSFGIGKNAVLAVSELQTVFYSTVYEDSGQKRFLAQGKAIMVAHKDRYGVHRRQTGYWGTPGFSAITDPAQAPYWMRREELGTSVFVLGFRNSPDWHERIKYSLIENFFPAIHKGEMEFSLDNSQIEIGETTLASIFDDPDVRATAATNDRENEFDTSRSLYRCLAQGDAKEEIVRIPLLGAVQVRVLVEDGLQKKIVIIRNGMVITDSLEHFGDRFARFPMYRDFVATVTPLDAAGSAFIKTLEDPKHKELSAEGLADAASRDQAKRVMKALAKEVRRIVKEHAFAQFETEVSADEMRRYFSTESAPSSESGRSTEENPQKIRYKVENRNRRPPYATGTGAEASGGGFGGAGQGPAPRNPGKGGGQNPNPRHPPGGEGNTNTVHVVPLEGVRNTRVSNGNSAMRIIYFTPAESGEADIVLQAVGLNENEDLVVRAATGADVSGGRLRRHLTAMERVRIDVQLEDEYDGPIDLRVEIRQATKGEQSEA